MIKYHLIEKEKFSEIERNLLADFLKKQGRVQGNLYRKIDRCKLICFASEGRRKIGVGAIKRKTTEDFEFAGLSELSEKFEWELGYFFTENEYSGKGIGKNIALKLINSMINENLMASTEFENNFAIDKILISNGFERMGTSWKSKLTKNPLGLYLRFKDKASL